MPNDVQALEARIAQLERQLQGVNLLLRQRLGNDPSTNYNPQLPQSPLTGGNLTLGALPKRVYWDPNNSLTWVNATDQFTAGPGVLQLGSLAAPSVASLQGTGGIGLLTISDNSPRINAIVGGNPSLWFANGQLGQTGVWVCGARTLTFTCGLLTGVA